MKYLFFKTAVAVVFSLFVISCGDEVIEEKPLRPVKTKQVFAEGGNRVRTFSGVSAYGTNSNLSFKLNGTISNLFIKVGDQVSAGQTLMQLDPTDYEIREKEADAARAQARAKERQAQANYERIRELWENKSVSRSDLDVARAAYETAHEQDNIAKKKRKLARRQLEYTKLVAPVNGAISQVFIDVNENVGPGQTVAVLTSGEYFEVNVSIPEMLISKINQGDIVKVRFDAIPNKSFEAKITEVGISSTGFATTYPVTVRLSELEKNIRSGMAAEVDFNFESSNSIEMFLVPTIAVAEDRSGRFVFVVKQNEKSIGIVHKKSVRVGDIYDDGIEILEGLEDGDYIVIAGVSKVKDQMKVKFNTSGEL